MTEPLLSIEDLTVTFRTRSESVRAVDGVSFEVYPGETVGVVGESGSGKSVTMLSMLRLLPRTSRVITSGRALLNGKDMLRASRRELRRIRGREVALIPQDPMTCLDPVLRIGGQLGEALRAHSSVSRDEQRKRAVELLASVGLPQPDRQYGQFPHELSGGMRQRVMIAMGMANNPSLLIADEPTTALDVTIQAQVMDILREAQAETQAGLVLITHDLGLIAEMADRVVVMYAGHVVETGEVNAIFAKPRHPYTVGLLGSLPQTGGDQDWLRPIPGSPPDLARIPTGCPFHPRCLHSHGREICRTQLPQLTPIGSDSTHRTACHFSDELADESIHGLLTVAQEIQ
ncbi:ABC transporter ATP-binding protein [Leekyejoonella antrihumi]|uniref:ABC transporter ATP-binding protein n=1 Tax=Leekyejoonella antrihumi TaxID=1660198 RepID=A0A563E7H9_9MICO|nr:ABC transporter ATP-binding protein [Leekyejoonella antrihumi]TWP38538.1 ABC transporter ATP-binding protein [Leekyejoonella antrihumi]